MFDRFRVRLSGLGPLVLRTALGVVFIVHGWPKMQMLLAGEMPLHRIVQNWPMPWLWSWLAGLTEFVGGVCLLAGLLTRFWSAGMVILMAVALWTAHPPFGDAAQPFKLAVVNGRLVGWEFVFTLGLMAAAVFLTGPGPISADHLLGRLFRGRRANPVVGAIWPPPEQPTRPPHAEPPESRQ